MSKVYIPTEAEIAALSAAVAAIVATDKAEWLLLSLFRKSDGTTDFGIRCGKVGVDCGEGSTLAEAFANLAQANDPARRELQRQLEDDLRIFREARSVQLGLVQPADSQK